MKLRNSDMVVMAMMMVMDGDDDCTFCAEGGSSNS